MPCFVNELDAVELAKNAGLDVEPVMIYGDDLTHIVTECGIAYLCRCSGVEERKAAIRGIAGTTAIGMEADEKETLALRERGIIKTPEDLGIALEQVDRSMLAAKNIKELVDWSDGLYCPPQQFRNW